MKLVDALEAAGEVDAVAVVVVVVLVVEVVDSEGVVGLSEVCSSLLLLQLGAAAAADEATFLGCLSRSW